MHNGEIPQRPPSSAAFSAAQAVTSSGQTLGVAAGLVELGAVPVYAYVAGLAWAAVAGAIGKVCRDELHTLRQTGERVSARRLILLNIGAVLG